ncbi:hypothetical protein HAZT_HAZT001195 [Hyalella azteca]|uniref:THUMP domain-containing protein 1-like n=1 Tax=Hyalella azteca TaxID=294128 RepID=A0A6A0H2D8_HYAAZ|nr:THUMP domain-containing protein 1-like [Hyalella azteca]KAA0196985.1 hypothetical protein HAZT_HAZT001195 [Hyalella azteca]
MGKFSKRKKSFYLPPNKKQRLDTIIGSVGYLATCNTHEDVCVKEGYSLLNCFADKLYGPEQIAGSEAPEADEVQDAEVSDTEEDADAALQKEVARLQTASQSVNQKGNAVQRRFQSIRCGAANNVFFRTTLADPLPTLLAAMDDILQTKLARTKHLIRLLPVHAVCKAYLDKIEKALAALCTEKFDGSQKSFYAVIKVMSNSAVKKEEVLSVVLKVMEENAPQCKPVLTKDAEVALVVSIIVTNCYIGIAPSYLGVYKKYNLNELAAPASADVPGNTSINDPVQKDTSDKVVEQEGCVEGAEDSAHAGNESEKANAEKDDSKTVADE